VVVEVVISSAATLGSCELMLATLASPSIGSTASRLTCPAVLITFHYSAPPFPSSAQAIRNYLSSTRLFTNNPFKQQHTYKPSSKRQTHSTSAEAQRKKNTPLRMSGRGAYYKAKYGGGRGRGRGRSDGGGTGYDDSTNNQDVGSGSPSYEISAAAGSSADLLQTLQRIDGKGYGAYKDLVGRWEFPEFSLLVDHAQADPFAGPSRCRVQVSAHIGASYP
jgi:hypothetical protein